MMERLLVIQVAGLGYDFLLKHHGQEWQGLTFRPAAGVFPALTCTVQASFRTAASPGRHGMIANGLWDRTHAKPRFWEQSSALVEGARIWDEYRQAGRSVAMLFWQQSLGENADVILSPAPIHKHHGGMIQDCYSRPADLYAGLRAALKRPFNLMHYWGPLASHRSSEWIAGATAALLADRRAAPDLCMTYLPVLDYDLQRRGTEHPRSRRALSHALQQLAMLKNAAQANGYELLIFGDYAMANVTAEPVYPNLALRREGLLTLRQVRQMTYPDLYTSPAFVVADHQIGHVYVRAPADIPRVRSVLEAVPGIERVIDRGGQTELGVAHDNAGELIVVADPGRWIAYPWWSAAAEAPDYAAHVDIHNKPGYDPCELLWGWPPGTVSRNPRRIRGTHGRTGPGCEIAWTSTFVEGEPQSLLELAAAVRGWLLNSERGTRNAE
jgi:predicted AlkP superfamily pyrophosphatase or phosphodiesterase